MVDGRKMNVEGGRGREREKKRDWRMG